MLQPKPLPSTENSRIDDCRLLACEFSISSRVMNFVGSSLKEQWQTKFHVALAPVLFLFFFPLQFRLPHLVPLFLARILRSIFAKTILCGISQKKNAQSLVCMCVCKSFRPFFLASCRTETRSQCLQRVCMIRFQNDFSMVPQKSLISWFPLGKSGPQFEFGKSLLGMKTHIIKPPYLLQTVV